MTQELEKTAAPKQVLDKKLWNKIEKSVLKYTKKHPKKYKEPYAIVMEAYLAAGGKLSHESKKKASATEEMIALGKSFEEKYHFVK